MPVGTICRKLPKKTKNYRKKQVVFDEA